jgi:hypothetical protein
MDGTRAENGSIDSKGPLNQYDDEMASRGDLTQFAPSGYFSFEHLFN